MAIGRFWDITIQDGDIFDGVRQTGFDPKEAGAVERGGVAAHLRPLAPEATAMHSPALAGVDFQGLTSSARPWGSAQAHGFCDSQRDSAGAKPDAGPHVLILATTSLSGFT